MGITRASSPKRWRETRPATAPSVFRKIDGTPRGRVVLLWIAKAAARLCDNWEGLEHTHTCVSRLGRYQRFRKAHIHRCPQGIGVLKQRVEMDASAEISIYADKLLRVYGGCLGSERRRRTLRAAICHGKPLSRLRSVDFRMGKPGGENLRHLRATEGANGPK